MRMPGGDTPRTRGLRNAILVGCVAMSLGSCAFLPAEFNLSPLYRHRLDRDGSVLEMDVLWPIVHYETMPDGGSDFRIRPVYRRVEKPDTEGFAESAAKTPATRGRQLDHQFLWPLGRVRTRDNEVHARLFPLVNYDSRTLTDGRVDTDWYCLFPFFWGGSDQKDANSPKRRYFGMFPLYLDAPGEFLTYDRLTMVLWPLYTRTEKDGRTGHIALWPFLGWGERSTEDQTYWYRVLPLFNVIGREGVFHRTSVFWPILTWGIDLLDTDDPMSSFYVWPLFGKQTSRKRGSWMFLWPLFRGQHIEGKKYQLDLLWPLFRWLEDDTGGRDVKQWWLWPFVSRTTATHQDSWSVLWPIIWWRQYDDAEGQQTQRWVVPFFKYVHREWRAGEHDWQPGGEDDYLQIWPLFHREKKRDGRREFAFPSPWFWRDGNEEGIGEAFDWLYTLFRTRDRSATDRSTDVVANLYTSRTRSGRTQRSVPFLFSYESEGEKSTVYLFNLFPIRFGGEHR